MFLKNVSGDRCHQMLTVTHHYKPHPLAKLIASSSENLKVEGSIPTSILIVLVLDPHHFVNSGQSNI
jgi:hypothetical protein